MTQVTAGQRLEALVAKHRSLHEEVDELVQRRYLTPLEQRRVTDLKKLKLVAKDQIAALKRRM